jgi:hypothetical protein
LPMSVGRSRWHDNDDGADAGDEGGGVEGGGVEGGGVEGGGLEGWSRVSEQR